MTKEELQEQLDGAMADVLLAPLQMRQRSVRSFTTKSVEMALCEAKHRVYEFEHELARREKES